MFLQVEEVCEKKVYFEGAISELLQTGKRRRGIFLRERDSFLPNNKRFSSVERNVVRRAKLLSATSPARARSEVSSQQRILSDVQQGENLADLNMVSSQLS